MPENQRLIPLLSRVFGRRLSTAKTVTTKYLALLIDGDNINSKKVQEILDQVNSLGRVLIKKVYINKASMGHWEPVIGKYSLTPFWVPNNTKNKNSVDIALTVDAMTLLYERPELTGFCIVSSDGDYTALVKHLLTKDKYVLGIGASSTPESFRNACTRFIYVEHLLPASTLSAAFTFSSPPGVLRPLIKPPNKPLSNPVRVLEPNSINKVRNAYIHAAFKLNRRDADGWVTLAVLGTGIKVMYPNCDMHLYKGVRSGKLKRVIERMQVDYPDTLEVKADKVDAYVRIKNAGELPP